MSGTRLRRPPAGLALVLLLTACGTTGGGSSGTTASCNGPAAVEQKQISYVENWLPWAAYAPGWAAQQNGYYKAEGLDVQIIIPSATQGDPIRLVGAGKAEFGTSQTTSVILAVQQGLPIVSVGATQRKLYEGLFFDPALGIHGPADLRGKTLGVNPDPIALAFTSTLLASAGLTKDDVKIVDPGFGVDKLVLTHKVAAGWGYTAYDGTYFKDLKGSPAGWLYWTDYGVPQMYEQVLIANSKWASQHPCATKAFLRATRKGLEAFLKNPEQFTPVLAQNNNVIPLDVQNEMATASAPQWTDALTQQYGLFYQEKKPWVDAQSYLLKAGLISKQIDPGQYFTTQYLVSPSG